MRHIQILLLSILFATLSLADQPNIILIFCDDMGYNDLGCFDSKKIKTPHLDQMAKEGRRFTNFMVPCSVCSPSRAALMTGCYPKRIEMHEHVLFPKSKRGMHPDEVTIADHLKSAGYATACVGKWHLGHYPETLPKAQGFDSYYGIPYSNDMNHPDNKRPKGASTRDDSWKNQASTLKWRTPLVIDNDIAELPTDQRTITRRYTDRAIEYVKEQATTDDRKPFFLYLPHSMPHIPLFVPDDAYDPDPANAYTCTIEHIDAEIGRLMNTVRELGIAKNTIVIFTSDNGPWLQFKNHGGSALPLRAGKGTPFEGGQRVPCVMWAPGRIPPGTSSDAFLSTMDVLPTIAKWVGKPLGDQRIDGHDASETITGDAPSPRTEMVYYTANGRLTGMRQGNWKYLVNPSRRKANPEKDKDKKDVFMLFNLGDDVSESRNLYEDHPDQVVLLRELMKQRDKEITDHQRKAWRATTDNPWPAYPDGLKAAEPVGAAG
ncbi:MAG: sulfatase [Planctomycetota bacterium]